MSAKVCQIEFFENGESCGISEFTMEEAQSAKVWSKNKNAFVPLAENNPNWKSYPRNMLFARAMSNGVRWFCPDVFDAPVYTPEELGANVDENGDYISVEAIPESTKPLPANTAISEAQQKRLFAISNRVGWPIELSKALIAEYGFESSKAITRDKYDAICTDLQNHEKLSSFIDQAAREEDEEIEPEEASAEDQPS